MRWRLVLAYDGAGFRGWQHQPGVRTVQGVLAEAVAHLNGGDTLVRGTSRTDAGVHALGQVAVFDARIEREARVWFHALNRHLPRDVAVRSVDAVPEAFHPRGDASGKTYRYHVWTQPWPNPLVHGRAAMLRRPLDVDAMREAAVALLGEQDFSALRAASCDALSPVKRIDAVSLGWLPDGCLGITVRGSGFLKYMVRALAGTLVEVGRGRRPPEWVAEILASRNRSLAGPTLVPEGLVLCAVHFPEHPLGAHGACWPPPGAIPGGAEGGEADNPGSPPAESAAHPPAGAPESP